MNAIMSRLGSSSSITPATLKTTTSEDRSREQSRSRTSPQPPRQMEQIDDITMHLLMETAMGESRDYELCSPEELDKIKRNLQDILAKIDTTKRQLAAESKVRDASGTFARLASKGDATIEAAAQKCDALSKELAELEINRQSLQLRLVQHTAAVLQATHRSNTAARDMMAGQINGTTTLDVNHFDDKHFYQSLESMLDEGIGMGGAAGGAKISAEAHKQHIEAVVEMERKLANLNQRLRDAIATASSAHSNFPIPPPASEPAGDDPAHTDASIAQQIAFLERGLDTLQRDQEISARQLETLGTQVREAIISTGTAQHESYQSVPFAQNTPIQSLFAYLERAISDLKTNSGRLLSDHRTISSRAEDHEATALKHEHIMQSLWQEIADGENFSVGGFESKVSANSRRLADLTKQKEILNRQIQQQREINSKSDGEKGAKMAALTTEVETLQSQAKEHMAQMASRARQVDVDKSARERQHAEVLKNLEEEHNDRIMKLQNDLTMTKAELEGAYGARAQRTVDASENAKLNKSIQVLQKELAETIAEYEIMTKSSIAFEKERETLENSIDGLRDRCEHLETQLHEEQVNKLGVKSPISPEDRSHMERGATSTSILKNEFKKMMKDTRAEHMKALKHEQEERRKLEMQLRDLRRGQPLVKSSLGSSIGSA